jgi:hypothetical protein
MSDQKLFQNNEKNMITIQNRVKFKFLLFNTLTSFLAEKILKQHKIVTFTNITGIR